MRKPSQQLLIPKRLYARHLYYDIDQNVAGLNDASATSQRHEMRIEYLNAPTDVASRSMSPGSGHVMNGTTLKNGSVIPASLSHLEKINYDRI
jgi:hypothetical protein